MNLKEKAFLAKLAYEPDMNRITEQLCTRFGIGLIDIEYIYVERTDTEGFLFRLGDNLIMAFSGTESLRDIWQDLVFLPAKYHDGYLHSGFKKISDLIKKPVCKAAQNLFGGDQCKEITAMGHSLGAPIVMCAGDSLAIHWRTAKTDITTFGCPNGWSKGARKGFNARHPNTTNYINRGDYVTWLLGISTSRPGKDVKLSGKWGHMMDKYTKNILALNNFL